jgi:hypothetical protein
MTYTVLFIVGIIIAGIIGNLPDKKQGKLTTITQKIFRALSLIGAAGVILYLFDILTRNLREDVSTGTIVASIATAIAILAVGNLMYYATTKYSEQKKRGDIAQYKLHLIKKGASVHEVLDPSYRSSLYGNALEQEAKEWAEKAANKPMKSYYD